MNSQEHTNQEMEAHTEAEHNLRDTAYLSELHAFHWGQIDVLSEAGRGWGEGRVARGHSMELRD